MDVQQAPAPEANEKLVCAILAEQVSALRDKMDASATFDLLWRTTALLSWLSGLLNDLSRHSATINPVLERERSEALAEVAEIRRRLDELAFSQAQKQDFSRQIADCVVTALERMAVAEMPAGTSFSSSDLAELYVSDDQRKLHEDVVSRFS
jgi:alkyl hydroperoxide reductase subunit AhpF